MLLDARCAHAEGSAATTLLLLLSIHHDLWLQLRGGIVYVPAGSDPAQFGHLLGGALQLVEGLPNPVFLVYDYVLHIAGGARKTLKPCIPFEKGSRACPTRCSWCATACCT